MRDRKTKQQLRCCCRCYSDGRWSHSHCWRQWWPEVVEVVGAVSCNFSYIERQGRQQVIGDAMAGQKQPPVLWGVWWRSCNKRGYWWPIWLKLARTSPTFGSGQSYDPDFFNYNRILKENSIEELPLSICNLIRLLIRSKGGGCFAILILSTTQVAYASLFKFGAFNIRSVESAENSVKALPNTVTVFPALGTVNCDEQCGIGRRCAYVPCVLSVAQNFVG
ncbi:hypothetical protein L2E82_51643 [Cichorium intybus]|nr:hypothetical protein L2E82_51643 [Cichorium intybus]